MEESTSTPHDKNLPTPQNVITPKIVCFDNCCCSHLGKKPDPVPEMKWVVSWTLVPEIPVKKTHF